jgi:hypothetical protein
MFTTQMGLKRPEMREIEESRWVVELCHKNIKGPDVLTPPGPNLALLWSKGRRHSASTPEDFNLQGNPVESQNAGAWVLYYLHLPARHKKFRCMREMPAAEISTGGKEC